MSSVFSSWFGSGDDAAEDAKRRALDKTRLPNGQLAPVYCASCIDGSCSAHPAGSGPHAASTTSERPLRNGAPKEALVQKRSSAAASSLQSAKQTDPADGGVTPRQEFQYLARLLAECSTMETNYSDENRALANSLAKMAERFGKQEELLKREAAAAPINQRLLDAHATAIAQWNAAATEHLTKLISYSDDPEFTKLCVVGKRSAPPETATKAIAAASSTTTNNTPPTSTKESNLSLDQAGSGTASARRSHQD